MGPWINVDPFQPADKLPRRILLFDVETNSPHPGRFSVLSFSALQAQTWRSFGHRRFQVLEELDRFYYPQEPYNYHAIKVNGLTQKVITQKRGRCDYPLHFALDQYTPQLNQRPCHAQAGTNCRWSQVTGIEQDKIVRIVSTEMLGEHAINAIYRDGDGRLGERMLFRSDEPSISLAEACWPCTLLMWSPCLTRSRP